VAATSGKARRPVQKAIRIVLADDHALVRAGLEKLLAAEPDFTVVGAASSAAQAVSLSQVLRPDVLLLDVSMPDGSGLDVLESLAPIPGLSVILLTAGIEEAQRAFAFRMGVKGVLLKDAATQVLFDGIRAVAAGDYWLWRGPVAPPPEASVPKCEAAIQTQSRTLTVREREVLGALIDGCSNREIAERMGISEDTVKHHLSSLFDKTGASSRVELVVFTVHHRLLDS